MGRMPRIVNSSRTRKSPWPANPGFPDAFDSPGVSALFQVQSGVPIEREEEVNVGTGNMSPNALPAVEASGKTFQHRNKDFYGRSIKVSKS
jgi:hypothetical protein